MIVTGNIQTLTGRIPVEQLKAGDIVIDNFHCPRTVYSVNPVKAELSLEFNGNPKLSVTEGTNVQTVYGAIKAEENSHAAVVGFNNARYDESFTSKTCDVAYEVKVKDADYIYVDNYAIEVIRC